MPSMPGNTNPSYKHGFAARGKRSNLYRRWQHMIQRCHNENDTDFYKYGARGIYVCDEWRKDYFVFATDMGPPPGRGYTIGRVDNDGPYSKANCRWETAAQQQNNRRNTVFLTIKGQTMALSAWCELAGIGSKTVLYRLKQGMSHEEAVFKPTNRKRAN